MVIGLVWGTRGAVERESGRPLGALWLLLVGGRTDSFTVYKQVVVHHHPTSKDGDYLSSVRNESYESNWRLSLIHI